MHTHWFTKLTFIFCTESQDNWAQEAEIWSNALSKFSVCTSIWYHQAVWKHLYHKSVAVSSLTQKEKFEATAPEWVTFISFAPLPPSVPQSLTVSSTDTELVTAYSGSQPSRNICSGSLCREQNHLLQQSAFNVPLGVRSAPIKTFQHNEVKARH